MKDIDFLPEGFRRQHAKRHTHLWRAVVVALFGLLLASTMFIQRQRLHEAQSLLAATRHAHDQVQNQVLQLGRLQADQASAEQEAQLITYLRHPWPRTRILAAVLEPLPAEITLDRLTIAQSESRDTRAPAASVLVDRRAEEERSATLAPAAHDLEQLRRELDATQTQVALSGKTTKAESVHEYLRALEQSPLVAKAELDSLEAETDRSQPGAHEAPMQFSITVVIRSGYGQPGGPTGPSSNVAGAARADSAAAPENRS